MNLHQIVRGAVSAVNPDVNISIQVSTGSTLDANRNRVPAFAAPVVVRGQIQALQYDDIRQLDALNIQGVKQKVYINGRVDGLIRNENKGGDLITFPDGRVYLVTLVLEYWPDWCCAAVTLQDGS
jgi:hypothetical protein